MNQILIPVCLFVRVSTANQDYERQIAELTQYAREKGYEVTKVIATKISGYKATIRQDLEQLYQGAKQGLFKKVLVLEVSRLGRKAKDIRATIDRLHYYGVPVVFKNLQGIESLTDGQESFVTNIIISIHAELAQEERRLLVERIQSGLEQAKRNGKKLGRRVGSKEKDEQVLKKYSGLVRDLKRGLSLTQCMKLHDASKNTVIKVKRLMGQEHNQPEKVNNPSI